MNRNSIIALAVAVVLGIIAVYLVNSYLTGQEGRIAAQEAAGERTQVAVASAPLGYGTEITRDRVRFVSYPTNALPPGTFSDFETLLPEGKTRHALRPIQVNQPLLAADLTGEGEGASIAATLPPGMRAATVQINAVSGVAGFIQPNDSVDVLITRQSITGEQQVTDVLLQNVRVIAMDQRAQDSNQPALSSTATLEVTPVDAQKLALGQQLGSLSLVLRKPGVEENIPTVETVSLNDLRYELQRGAYEGATAAVPEPTQAVARPTRRFTRPSAPARPAPPPKPRVEVTRGLDTSSYEVGEYEE